MLFGRRKPGYTTTVDAASDPEQVILDLQKAEMAAKKKPKAEFFDIDAASEHRRQRAIPTPTSPPSPRRSCRSLPRHRSWRVTSAPARRRRWSHPTPCW